MLDTVKKMVKSLRVKGSSTRHVGILATGTALSQAIVIAASPILTRLYTPADFGLVSLYMACAAVLVIFATGAYEQAIVIPASDEEALNITVFTLLLCGVVSALTLIPVIFFGHAAANLLGSPQIANWFYLLPVTVAATGAFATLQFWCNRKSEYRQMTMNRLQSSGFTAVANIALGLTKTSGGMILGTTLGQFLATSILTRHFIKTQRPNFSSVNFKTQWEMAKKYRRHPLHLAPGYLIGSAAEQVTIFMIGSLFSLATLGFFSMAYKLISLPSMVVARAIGDVYRQRISVAYNERGQFRDIFLKTLATTTVVALPPFFILYLIAPWLFATVLGSDWRIAGEYAQILVVGSFFHFIVAPVDKGVFIVGASKYLLLWFSGRLVSFLILLFAAGHYSLGIVQVLWIFVGINIFFYLLHASVNFYLSRGNPKASNSA